jgi:hypothetical protein
VNRKWARFIECKGYQPGGLVDDDEIRTWLERRVPLVYSEARKNSEMKDAKISFELWTTGRLTQESIEMIETAKRKTRKYSIDYLDALGVLEIAKQTKETALVRVLLDHFIDHPMATAEDEVERQRQRTERRALRSVQPAPSADITQLEEADVPF